MKAEVMAAIDTLSVDVERRPNNAVDIAMLHTLLGETDQALDWLQIALDLRSPLLVNLRLRLWSIPLQNDPRILKIVRGMGMKS